jgi:predicted methyltransferase
MKSGIKGLLIAVSVSTGPFLNAQAAAQQGSPPLSSEQIAQIVRSSDRTAADRANDERRKPEQMLASSAFVPVSSRSISARAVATQRNC